MVDPAGPAAAIIATLWWVMLVGAVLILVMVLGLLAVAFRRRTPADERQSERFWIVWLGLGFPMSVLAALLIYGLFVGERLLPRQTGADVVEVAAEARRWSWRFAYKDRPGTTEDVLHIPAGQPIDIAITSRDVVHSFWVPRLAGKLDAIPGRVNVLRLQADHPGTYQGVTAEYNGVGYLSHDFEVVAHDAEGWQAFLAGDTP